MFRVVLACVAAWCAAGVIGSATAQEYDSQHTKQDLGDTYSFYNEVTGDLDKVFL